MIEERLEVFLDLDTVVFHFCSNQDNNVDSNVLPDLLFFKLILQTFCFFFDTASVFFATQLLMHLSHA